MAFLDVTDVVLDPDFMDSIVYERNTVTVGSNGLATQTTATGTFLGVVTSNTGDILERLADSERIKGSITIHSMFTLNDGSTGTTADIVLWKGRRYTVSNVNDYSHFGRGFVAATCDLIPLSG